MPRDSMTIITHMVTDMGDIVKWQTVTANEGMGNAVMYKQASNDMHKHND